MPWGPAATRPGCWPWVWFICGWPEVSGVRAFWSCGCLRFLPGCWAVLVAPPSLVALRSLKDQWLLVSVGGGDCAAACQQNLYFQRQLRESLGREKERLDRVWLVSDDAPVADALQPALDGATVLRVPADQLAAWLVPTAGHPLQAHLFVVDPLGNLMMRFPPGLDLATAAKAKKDLERLLRASNSWDQPGRP